MDGRELDAVAVVARRAQRQAPAGEHAAYSATDLPAASRSASSRTLRSSRSGRADARAASSKCWSSPSARSRPISAAASLDRRQRGERLRRAYDAPVLAGVDRQALDRLRQRSAARPALGRSRSAASWPSPRDGRRRITRTSASRRMPRIAQDGEVGLERLLRAGRVEELLGAGDPHAGRGGGERIRPQRVDRAAEHGDVRARVRGELAREQPRALVGVGLRVVRERGSRALRRAHVRARA